MDKERYEFCWIVDFPMYEIGDESGELEFCHNPFSMPAGGLDVLLKAERGEIDPLTITADQYDLVCNGVELSSGAVRNHDPEIMIKAFELVRLGEEDVKAKFPAMYNAFCYGAPPHAGIAPGVDRMVMLITGEDLDEFEAFDLYDFKYSNNAKNYAVSGQLHEYKYWYELTHPGHRIRNMYFLIVPKAKIRQKSTETLSQFRDRLQAALKDAEPTLMPVQYNPMKIVDFLTDVKHMVEATDFPKNPNHFCGWCEYEEYCQKGWDYMLLPKNERRDLNATKKKVVWLYGAPFSGKTFFANQFPDPLMLNTDGNIKFVDAPYIAIRDTVTVEGRITKRKLAYEVFMDAVAELEKKQNDFRTIVVDLLEDVYESCRVYICDRQGWKHESDDSFRAWDMVRSEFLNTLKRLVNLDYENIILISHEDRSRDLTRKGGDKISSIKPNLQDKVANKVAGMVDLVARIVADDDERVLSFKTSEVIFGGGRLTVRDKEIPLTYDAFCEVYEEANQKAAGAVKRGGNAPATPAPETTDTPTTAPSRRGRKAKTVTPPPAGNYDPAEDAAKAACGDPDGTWTPGGGEKDDSVPVDEPATGDTPPWNDLPKCPDGERIFRQHDQNPEIPLCPSIDAGHRCHKEGGPDGCPLWDRPKAQAEEPAPKTDANPPRRTRKKREE